MLHDKFADHAVVRRDVPAKYYILIFFSTLANITDNTSIRRARPPVKYKNTVLMHHIISPIIPTIMHIIIPVVFNAPLSWTRKEY